MKPALLSALLITLVTSAHAQTTPAFETWLTPDASFWTLSPAEFEPLAAPLGFRWLSAGREARAAPLSGTLWGAPVSEVQVRFENDRPIEVRAWLYNRGDDTALDEIRFERQVEEAVAAVDAWTGRKGLPQRDLSPRSDVRDGGRVWQFPGHRYTLEWSSTPASRTRGTQTPFRAEYLRFTAGTFRSGDPTGTSSARVNVFAVRGNLSRDPATGDVWLANVPMVDQGPKGYCAAATAERILRYFGMHIDQHEVAQLANTSARGGTSTAALQDALRAVGRQYGFSLREHMSSDVRDLKRLVDAYNRAAAAQQKPAVRLRGTVIDEVAVLRSMDNGILLQVRQAEKTERDRFERTVRKYVDGACPLAWGVIVGLVEEVPPVRGSGGHLRMIIGYNAKTREVLYSDSWGSGHERKRMPLEEAFAISRGLWSLEPRGMRL